MSKESTQVSIILPCRNEEQALGYCLSQIKSVIANNKLSAEIIVSDSSTDSSPSIAKKHKVRLIKHDKVGYGNAYLSSFPFVKGKYIIMGDADGTYDFRNIPFFLEKLKSGNDLVIGNRFAGTIKFGAMPTLHKYVGNPVLSFIFRLFFRSSVKDVHCGLRGIKKTSLDSLSLQTTGMEFASEMIIKAVKKKMHIAQLPINYHPRIGESKLQSFSDGWRHLRFMLLYSPFYLFFLPGFLFFLLGFGSMIWFLFFHNHFFSFFFYEHPLFFSSLSMIFGYQLVLFGLFARTYTFTHLKEKSSFMTTFYRFFKLKTVAWLSLALVFFSISIPVGVALWWLISGFPSLEYASLLTVSSSFAIIGMLSIFSSFMMSILAIKEKGE